VPFSFAKCLNYDGDKGGPVQIHVDYDLCTSNAVCMGIAPEIFEVRDDGFMYVLNENPGPEFDERLQHAVDGCPNGAISIEK
jgi:ferredoxin